MADRELMSWKRFLESSPPGTTAELNQVIGPVAINGMAKIVIADLDLHCDHRGCDGNRRFSNYDVLDMRPSDYLFDFLNFICNNCKENVKKYAVRIVDIRVDGHHRTGTVTKIGEYPAFGQPLPSRVVTMFKEDKDLLFQGRRCENQALGIGAFAYYRRIVEGQKSRLLSEITRVARRLEAPADAIATLERAAKERQFVKALSDARDAIPQSLFIDGINPMMLLHNALSEGLHAGTDEQCLQAATVIRLVLSKLSERISDALEEDEALKAAVKKLESIRQQKQLPPP